MITRSSPTLEQNEVRQRYVHRNSILTTMHNVLKESQEEYFPTCTSSDAKNKTSIQLEKIAKSVGFELVVWAIIALNICMVVLETAYGNELHQYRKLFQLISMTCMILFFFDVMFKLIILRREFVNDPYNIFDVIILMCSFGPYIVFILTRGPHDIIPSFARKITTFRVLRLLRIIQTISYLPYMKELWLMIQSMALSLRVLLWGFLLGFIVIFVFAILAYTLSSYVIQREAKTPQKEEEMYTDLKKYWGTLYTCIQSLFQVMTLENWPTVVESMMYYLPATWYFFVTFVGVAVYSLTNIFTAVLVDSAFQASREGERAQQWMLKRKAMKVIENIRKERFAKDAERISFFQRLLTSFSFFDKRTKSLSLPHYHSNGSSSLNELNEPERRILTSSVSSLSSLSSSSSFSPSSASCPKSHFVDNVDNHTLNPSILMQKRESPSSRKDDASCHSNHSASSILSKNSSSSLIASRVRRQRHPSNGRHQGISTIPSLFGRLCYSPYRYGKKRIIPFTPRSRVVATNSLSPLPLHHYSSCLPLDTLHPTVEKKDGGTYEKSKKMVKTGQESFHYQFKRVIPGKYDNKGEIGEIDRNFGQNRRYSRSMKLKDEWRREENNSTSNRRKERNRSELRSVIQPPGREKLSKQQTLPLGYMYNDRGDIILTAKNINEFLHEPIVQPILISQNITKSTALELFHVLIEEKKCRGRLHRAFCNSSGVPIDEYVKSLFHMKGLLKVRDILMLMEMVYNTNNELAILHKKLNLVMKFFNIPGEGQESMLEKRMEKRKRRKIKESKDGKTEERKAEKRENDTNKQRNNNLKHELHEDLI